MTLTGVHTIAVSTRMYESGERIAITTMVPRRSSQARAIAPGERLRVSGTSTRQRKALVPQS